MPLNFAMSLMRSEEHTSELQSLRHLVCRLLLEKKNNYLMIYAVGTAHDVACLDTSDQHVYGCRVGRGPFGTSTIGSVPREPFFILFFFKERAHPEFLPLSPPRRPPV